MKLSYSKTLRSTRLAVLDLSEVQGWDGMDPKGLIINRINTPHDYRGKGHARELMTQCLADADTEGITLYLWINAYGDMSEEQLIAWYGRLGFENRDGTFVRKPQVSSAGTDKKDTGDLQ